MTTTTNAPHGDFDPARKGGTAASIVTQGNAADLYLPDETVDLIVTSPPYFGLRSYQDDGQHYSGQIGDEATPAEYLDALIACTAEWMRVLKPGGSIFVNLGDKYQSTAPGTFNSARDIVAAGGRESEGGKARGTFRADMGVKPKSLAGLPWRYAIRCIDELGLILRAEIIWSKCLSGGTQVYAQVDGREKVATVKDLARCVPGSVKLWTGEKWSPMLRCDPTPPTEGRAESSAAARRARYLGKPIPPLAADLEIEFRNGERIGCTPNHRWPTARGIVRADELTVGDIVPTVRLAPGSAPVAGLDDEMTGWLVGLYIAEGSRSEDMVQIASHVRETERFDRLQVIADAFDGRFALHHTKGNTATANLSGKIIRGILDTYVGGRTSGDKRLAPACWRRSDTFLRALLDGYLSGDGHHDVKNDRWILGFTANDGLATDLRALAARLGYSLRLRRRVHTFDGRQFPGWGGTLVLDPARHRRPDGEVVAVRQSRARQFWNIEIADEPHEFALASGLRTCNSNGLPESVTDRVRRSHEQLFHFVKQPRYYSAVDEVREEHTMRPQRRPGGRPKDLTPRIGQSPQSFSTARRDEVGVDGHPLGKLPGSVWTIPTAPLTVPAHLGIDHFACVDDQTEVLTRRGWLVHDEIRDDDEVAGTDLDTGLTRWTRIHGIHRYDYDGDLIAADARGLSMRLTPNHRTLVHRHAGRHRLRQPVEVVRADEVTSQHGIPRAVDWSDDGREKAIGIDLAALCGWVAAEGWVAGSRVLLSQSQTANPQHVTTIDALLARLGGARRSERLRTNGRRPYTDIVWALPKVLAAEVLRLLPGKLLPATFGDLPMGEARALLEAFIAGDGHDRPDGRRAIFQKIRQNLDVLQTIAVRCGYNTTLARDDSNDRWVLYLNPPRPARLRRSDGTSLVGREHYTGVVWCITTGTGTFVARRRGTVFVTGNSFPPELVRRIVLGWSPREVCTACGEGRRPVVARGSQPPEPDRAANRLTPGQAGNGTIGFRASKLSGQEWNAHRAANPDTITGYACACPDTTAPTTPGVVLDPFMGTGTTVLVAEVLGRVGIGVDLSADYVRLARWRTTDPVERRRAAADVGDPTATRLPDLPDPAQALF
jgi:hypothetical protein